jgi:YidC/Oxa1 family membrane protein insertase
MDDQNKNLILATALSFLVILVWFVLFPPEEAVIDPAQQDTVATGQSVDPLTPSAVRDGADPAEAVEAMEPEVAEAARIAIDTPRLSGTLSLQGGRIDDLALKDYRETIDPASPIVQLMNPVGGRNAYYALYGWSPGGALSFDDVPGPNTVWTQVGDGTLAPDAPVTLEWQNGNGLTFTRVVEIDDNYLFTVTQSVTNTGTEPVRLYPYGLVARHGVPDDLENFFILHEGLVMKTDGNLNEDSYSSMSSFPLREQEGPGARAEVVEVESQGWLGFTDKYWMTTLMPRRGSPSPPSRATCRAPTSIWPKPACR